MSDAPDTDGPAPSHPVYDWLANLPRDSINAASYGAVYAFLAAALASPYVLAVGIGVLLWAYGIRASPFRFTRSGDKKPDFVDDLEEDLEERAEDDQSRGLVARVLADIRHRPHYFTLGFLVGDRAGYVAHYLYYGVRPEHYEKLPEIFEWLLPSLGV